jgi:hypothetical protein
MDLPTELKFRLSAYLEEKGGLEEFRLWFADVLRTVNEYEKPVQSLIWSTAYALAKFGSGRASRDELHKDLKRVLNPTEQGVANGDMNVSPDLNGSYRIDVGTIVVGTSQDFQIGERHVLPLTAATIVGNLASGSSGSSISAILPIVEMAVPPAWMVSNFSSCATA